MAKDNLRKYSKKAQQKWVEIDPIFDKKSLLINDYQVMQRWEDNYMKSLAAVATSNGGRVLEVGFGLGMSARFIQRSKKIQLHNVVECHPKVIQHAKSMFSKELASGRMKISEGFWEDVTPKMPSESFDGILFDSCPLESGVEFFQFFPFFSEAYRLLKKGGIFTYFSDEQSEISSAHLLELKKAGFKEKDIKFKIVRVNPPKSTEYWKHKTIVCPIVTKS